MRITLTTFGSYGDLHPTLALALALQRVGHTVRLATSEVYRGKIERTGLCFSPIRPDDVIGDMGLISKALDPTDGPKTVIRDLTDAAIKDTYEDIAALVPDTDLFITSPLSFATVLAASKYRIPWISTVLAPISFFSIWDPPTLPNLLWARKILKRTPKPLLKALFTFARLATRSWCHRTLALARTLGLPKIRNPIFEDQFSPHGTLALFSPILGCPQADWPDGTRQTGFLFYDQGESLEMPAGLFEFISQGEPPIIVTLGSIMMMDAGDFFVKCAKVARQMGRRAILLYGRDHPQNVLGISPGKDLFMADYAPFSKIFHLASVIIHQGGVGTTAQAIRAGVPTLIVPFSHDQPDNAYRMEALGISKTIERRKFTIEQATQQLTILLEDPAYTRRANVLGKKLSQEQGEQAAVMAIESILANLIAHHC